MRRRCGRWPRRRPRRSRRAGIGDRAGPGGRKPRTEAAQHRMDRQTLRDWVHRFNAEGPGRSATARRRAGRDGWTRRSLPLRRASRPAPSRRRMACPLASAVCQLGGGPLPGQLPRARHGQDPALARLLPHLGAPGASPGRPRRQAEFKKNPDYPFRSSGDDDPVGMRRGAAQA